MLHIIKYHSVSIMYMYIISLFKCNIKHTWLSLHPDHLLVEFTSRFGGSSRRVLPLTNLLPDAAQNQRWRGDSESWIQTVARAARPFHQNLPSPLTLDTELKSWRLFWWVFTRVRRAIVPCIILYMHKYYVIHRHVKWKLCALISIEALFCNNIILNHWLHTCFSFLLAR